MTAEPAHPHEPPHEPEPPRGRSRWPLVIGGAVVAVALTAAVAVVLRAGPGTVYTALPDCARALPADEAEYASASGPVNVTDVPLTEEDPTRLECRLAAHYRSEMSFRVEVDLLEPGGLSLEERREETREFLAEAAESLAEEEVGRFTANGWTYDDGVWRSAGFGDGGISVAVSDIDVYDENPMTMAYTGFVMDNLFITVTNERHLFRAESDLMGTLDRTEAIAALLVERLPDHSETE